MILLASRYLSLVISLMLHCLRDMLAVAQTKKDPVYAWKAPRLAIREFLSAERGNSFVDEKQKGTVTLQHSQMCLLLRRPRRTLCTPGRRCNWMTGSLYQLTGSSS